MHIIDPKILDPNQPADVKVLDEKIRLVQDETSNHNWGYWHVSLLSLVDGTSLEEKIRNTLSLIPKYQDPYMILSTGERHLNSGLDLNNLKFETITDLRSELISKCEHWSHYQGPTTNRKGNSEHFERMNLAFADDIVNFFSMQEVMDMKLVGGIDTFYSFGGDHCGDDLLIDTKTGTYVIHFGFSS